MLKTGQCVISEFLFSPQFYKCLFPSLNRSSVLWLNVGLLDAGSGPPRNRQCPITRISWTHTRLDSERTPMQHVSCVLAMTAELFIPSISAGDFLHKEEGNKGTPEWPPGHSEQNPYVWNRLRLTTWLSLQNRCTSFNTGFTWLCF